MPATECPRAQGSDRSECLTQEWSDFVKLHRLGMKKDPPGRKNTVVFFSNDSLPSSGKLTSLNLSSLKGGILSLRGKMKTVSGYFKACEFPCFAILPPNTKYKTASRDHPLKRHGSAVEKHGDTIIFSPWTEFNSCLLQFPSVNHRRFAL